MVVDGTAERKEAMLNQANRAPRQALIDAVKGFNEAALTAASSWQPQLPLELAFIELLPAEAAPRIAPTPQPVAPTAPVVTASVAQPVAKAVEKPQPKAATPPKPEPVPAAPPPQPEADDEAAASQKPQPVQQSTENRERATDNVTVTPHIGVSDIMGCWPEMVNLAGQSERNLPPLLNMSKPLGLEGDTIILGFDFPIFKDKFDKYPGAPHLVGEIFSHLLHTKCNVRAVVTSDYTIPITKEEFDGLANELGGVVHEE
jgi:hypothetical protein